jgi:hypothetical protein
VRCRIDSEQIRAAKKRIDFGLITTACFPGSATGSIMYEVVIIERGPTRWEWRLCNSNGVLIMQGRENTRAETRYQGNRALFNLLIGGRKPLTRPERQ